MRYAIKQTSETYMEWCQLHGIIADRNIQFNTCDLNGTSQLKKISLIE